MFGRIRASPSSLDTLDGSPSKILKDDSFSVYEATLMKLKLGAQRDTSATSKEIDEVYEDSSASSSCCVEEDNLKPNCNLSIPVSASDSHQHIVPSLSDEITMMETDCSSISTSPSFSEHVSAGNTSEQQRQNNVSILRFFKLKDPGNSSVLSCREVASTKDGSSRSLSSSGSVESHYRSELDSVQSLEDCEL